MILKYNLSIDDYVKFNIYHYENSKTFKSQFLTLRLLVPVILSIILFFKYYTSTSLYIHIIASIPVVIIGLLWFIFFPKLFKKTLKSNIKRMMNNNSEKEFMKDITISLLDNKICEQTNESLTESNYSVIKKIGINDNDIYIYITSINAYIVPSHAFTTEDQRTLFVNTLKEKCIHINH